MIHLQAKLAARPEMLELIRTRLEHTARQAEHFSDHNQGVITAIAGLYQDTISQFSFRIQVTGMPQFLQQQANADKIRMLLLAGIRAATVWQQKGGKRWRLVFQRNALQRSLKQLQDN